MNVAYGQDIPGALDKHFKKNKRNLKYWMILWMKHQRALKLLSCLHVVVNLFVIYLTHLFHKNQCTLHFNLDYVVIFKNPRDNSQFATIARQIRPDKVKFLMWAYKVATSSLHCYLMLHMKPETEASFRVRSNILEDPQQVYITY